jgi:hypothetical protein
VILLQFLILFGAASCLLSVIFVRVATSPREYLTLEDENTSEVKEEGDSASAVLPGSEGTVSDVETIVPDVQPIATDIQPNAPDIENSLSDIQPNPTDIESNGPAPRAVTSSKMDYIPSPLTSI